MTFHIIGDNCSRQKMIGISLKKCYTCDVWGTSDYFLVEIIYDNK